MDKHKIINNILDKKKENLTKALISAKEARNNAPGAMESHSDTSRSQYEKLIAAMEQQIKDLEEIYKQIGLNKIGFTVIEVKINGDKKKFMLVPEGLGGEEIDGIRLLSKNSPLGLQLVGKKEGDKFEFNGQLIEILKRE